MPTRIVGKHQPTPQEPWYKRFPLSLSATANTAIMCFVLVGAYKTFAGSFVSRDDADATSLHNHVAHLYIKRDAANTKALLFATRGALCRIRKGDPETCAEADKQLHDATELLTSINLQIEEASKQMEK